MSREKVIELAKQAGCNFPLRSGMGDCRVPQFFSVDGLERFAALVEADTIERCAAVCEAKMAGLHDPYIQCAAAIRSLK